jgi:hypothetical protein
MLHIFRCADQTISWLGFPALAQLDGVCALHELGHNA